MIVCSLHDTFLAVLQRDVLTSGSRRTAEMKFVIDDAWQIPGAELYITFAYGTPEQTLRVPMADKTVTIPAEVLQAPGFFSFAVCALTADGSIIKTSTVCRYTVVAGADPGADVWIDWEQFKSDLIAALNERFSLELAPDADNDAILEAIASLQNGAEVRAWWIDFIGRALQTPLSPDDSDVDISLHVSMAIDRMLEGSRHYHTLAGLVTGLLRDHVPDYTYSGMIEPEYLEQIPVLDSHMTSLEDDRQTVITALSNLYIGG